MPTLAVLTLCGLLISNSNSRVLFFSKTACNRLGLWCAHARARDNDWHQPDKHNQTAKHVTTTNALQ